MNQTLETNDIFKGAYLLSCSFTLKETRFVDSHQVRFVIEGENIDQEDLLYHTGRAKVNPLRLKEWLNFLREILNRTLETNKPRRSHASNSQRGNRKN